jgi:hypothetical protein
LLNGRTVYTLMGDTFVAICGIFVMVILARGRTVSEGA